MIRSIWTVLALASLGVLTACSAGNDPLNILGEPGQMPILVLPLRTTTTDAGAVKPYLPSTGADGLDILAISGARVRAPGTGVITKIESLTSGIAITIYHNAQFSSRVSQLSTVLLRVGDYVKAGDDLGLPSSALYVRLTTYANGAIVCPYSFLDDDGRTWVNNNITPIGGAICGK